MTCCCRRICTERVKRAVPGFEIRVTLTSLGTSFFCGARLLAWLFEVKNTVVVIMMRKVLLSESQVPLS